MKKLTAGLVLILMMLGHNYVINQPQSLQKQIQNIHQINVTSFNLLYSIPSLLALLTTIPIGLMYYKYPNFTLLFGIFVVFVGQLLVSMFGSEGKPYFFSVFIAGRTLQGTGAEILYMIQGNLASSWMSHLAGFIFILPEVGEILNAFFTPFAAITWGVRVSLWLGVAFCLISVVACCYLYIHLKKIQKIKKQTLKIQMFQIQSNKQFDNNSTDVDSDRENPIKTQKQKMNKEQTHKKLSQDDEITINSQKQQISQPKNIFKAGVVFWLTIAICAINECLYFPFLDNANELIQIRFKIPYQDTGYYLCLPFLAAIFTTLVMSRLLLIFQRKELVFYTSLLPFVGHMIILNLPNSQEQTISSSHKFILALGFFIFGTGIGGYYSISFPAVGLAVPSQIRGLAYGILCFFQTLAMTLIPIISGFIIEEDEKNEIQGYRNNSIMFVIITFTGMIVAYCIKLWANSTSFMYDDEEVNSEENMGLIQSAKEKSHQSLQSAKKSQSQQIVEMMQQSMNSDIQS